MIGVVVQIVGPDRSTFQESVDLGQSGTNIRVQVQGAEGTGRVPPTAMRSGEGGIQRIVPVRVGNAQPDAAIW